MATGRRPNGLCGAAILVAAKIHGFKRTTAQIVQVVRVCEETIRKRLDEFKDTNTAQLKLKEFEELEDKNSDPFQFAIPEVDYVPKPKFKVPAISIKAIQQVLEVDDEDLPQIQEVLMAKGRLIDKKLQNDDEDSDGEGELEIDRVHNQPLYNLGNNSQQQQLMKIESKVSQRQDMTINTIDYNTKEGEIIPFDNVDDVFLSKLMRSSGEIDEQQNLWNSKNAEYVKEMERKRQQKENKKLKDGKQNAVQSHPVSLISPSESKYAYSQGGMVKGDINTSDSGQIDVID